MANWLEARSIIVRLAIFVVGVLATLAMLSVAHPSRTVTDITIAVGMLVVAGGLVWKRWRSR